MSTPADARRKGPRSAEQRKRELMRRARSQQSPYSIGGNKKAKGHAPKPITLAPIATPSENDSES
jgi:hypothetical protein